jgi:hypothetical protein
MQWRKISNFELLSNGSWSHGYENFKPNRKTSLEPHEIVYGGDVLRDLEALESAENELEEMSYRTALKGFERLYGLSADQYGSEIIKAQKSRERLLAVLNIRSNLQILDFWKSNHKKQNLLEMADSTIEKWKSNVKSNLAYSKRDLFKDYETLRMLYEGAKDNSAG